MADGHTHFAVSAAAAGIAAIALLTVDAIPREGVLILFACGIAGGMLPDIDTGHSPSLNAVWTLSAVILSFLAVFTRAHDYAVAELVLLWLAVYLALRLLVFRLLMGLTRHRGMIHSVPVAMVCGLAGVVALHRLFGLSLTLAWLGGIFVLAGFLGHLLLDELVSLNLFGVGQKVSLGSAFKFFSREWRPTLLAWLLVVVLLLLVPPPHGALDLLGQGNFWQKLHQRLLPREGWFRH